jgi:serine/threonine-protein kinase RsbW/stage II sporulation protein AB (anti-sigma F factor)
MTAVPDPLQLRVPARPEVVAGVRRSVTSYARDVGGVTALGDLELAVSEVVTNAVLHAYVEQEPGDVEVLAEREPDNGLKVTVSDRGRGICPRTDSPGLGLGLPLVARLATSFEMQSPPGGGSRVCMHFA